MIDGKVAIEVRATSSPSARDFGGLRALGEEGFVEASLLVCGAKEKRMVAGAGLPMAPVSDGFVGRHILREKRVFAATSDSDFVANALSLLARVANMDYVQRNLELKPIVGDRSCFLFGPRQTGKTTYLKHQLSEEPALNINLLERTQYLRHQMNPGLLVETVRALDLTDRLVVIDEIQKLPELLDSVHLLIEERGLRFILTGSSARKLKRAGTNLLGGRARTRNLHGFVSSELGGFAPRGGADQAFSLSRAIHNGTLPSHYFSALIDEDLAAYVGKYLVEEVSAEGLSRNIPAFSRFLEVAALCCGEMINYTSIASDVGLSRQTVVNYFEILADTQIGYLLPPFRRTRKRKSVAGVPKLARQSPNPWFKIWPPVVWVV